MLKKLSVKLKIYFIAVVSAVGFGTYLAYNLQVNFANSNILEDVRDTYFPILEKANSSAVMLDRIKELLRAAVQTGELSYIEDAQNVSDKVKTLFKETHALEPDRKKNVKEFSGSFNEYFKLTKEIALEMAQGEPNFNTLPKRVEQKEILFEKTKSELQSFIKFAHGRFENDVARANKNADKSLITGFLIWILSIFLLTAAVITIARLILRNIQQVATSLTDIAHGSGDFNKTIVIDSDDEIGQLGKSFNELLINLKEKTNDLISMMQNMHQGLFTITRNGLIHPEYSAYLETIFNTVSIAGLNYKKLLFEQSTLGSDTLNQATATVDTALGEDEMMWQFNAYLLPREYNLCIPSENTTNSKIIELEWDPIIADGVVDKIMVTVRDVTELRALENEAKQQKRELEIVGQILAISLGKFDTFVDDTQGLLKKNHSLLTESKLERNDLLAKLFVNMHTIKGNARTLGLSFIKDAVHEAESTYDQLRKNNELSLNKEDLREEINLVESKLKAYIDIRKDKLEMVSNYSDSLSDDQVKLPRNLFERLIESCHVLLNKENMDSERESIQPLLSEINLSRGVALEDLLDDIILSLPDMAKELNKESPKVIFGKPTVIIEPKYASMLQSVFTHLLRNALDHGIEISQERLERGKSQHGKIEIKAEFKSDNVYISIRDDGRGLALGKLKRSAIEQGIVAEEALTNAGDVAELIFHSGFSTAEQVTDISGRGVGMDAVRSFLREHQCDIKIELAQHATIDNEFAQFATVLVLNKPVVLRSLTIDAQTGSAA